MRNIDQIYNQYQKQQRIIKRKSWLRRYGYAEAIMTAGLLSMLIMHMYQLASL